MVATQLRGQNDYTHSFITSEIISQLHTLRAKDTLISEPRFSTPCDMRFCPRDTGKRPLQGKSPRKGHFPFIARGKSHVAGQQTRIYPYPMVWPLPRPWSETMVSIPLLSTENPRNKGFSGSGAPILGFGSRRPRAQGVGVDPCFC